jgi:hypothetical protein
MGYRIFGLALWLAFFLIVPIKHWRWVYPAVIFTALLALVCDLLGVVFLQWEYIGPVTGGLSLWSDLGIAPPSGGLAVYLHHRYPRWAWLNWSFWIFANAIGEWVFVKMGFIRYHEWNSLKATLFYLLFFAIIYLQDRWYRGGGADLNHAAD